MDKKQPNKYTKITKVSLVIYCLIMVVLFTTFLIISATRKEYSFLYAYLLCLGPSLIFVFVSVLLPIPKLVEAKTGKGIIAVYIIAYIIKYALLIGIPFIGLANEAYFNRWVMLATTLVAPIAVIIIKLIFANIVSKSSKNEAKIG